MDTITVRSLGKMQHLVIAKRHAFVADEPPDAGDDLGPNPYEFLLSALGTCTAMTLLLYARRKEWPLEEVTVELSHQRVHADDCEECDEHAEGYVDIIRRSIVVKGDLSQEQQGRLLEIAKKCPVHKTLKAVPQIVDALECRGAGLGTR